MAKARVQQAAAVGVAEHGNSAVLVTVAPGGELLDRRRVDLTRGLPTHPYHHEGSWAVGRYLNSPWARAIPLADAVALVERVQEPEELKSMSEVVESQRQLEDVVEDLLTSVHGVPKKRTVAPVYDTEDIT